MIIPSRGSIPTDNLIIEALIGWMMEELFLDFDLAHAMDISALLDSYVGFFKVTQAPFSTSPDGNFSIPFCFVYFFLTRAQAFPFIHL